MKQQSVGYKIPGLASLQRRFPPPIWAQTAVYRVEVLLGDINRCDLLKQASAMAYTTLLSIVPSLAALFSVLTIFTPILGQDSQLMAQAQSFIISNLAQGTGDQVANVLNEFIAKLDVTKIGITSFAGLLVTLIMLLQQIEAALNRVWLVRKERSMLMRSMYFWTFLTLGGFVIALVAGVLSGFNLAAIVPFGEEVKREAASPLWKAMVGYITAFGFFFAVYKLVPNCKVAVKEALIGAALAAFLFQQAGRGFGYYVQNFSKHEAVYGALAALPLFLTWIYVCWLIILFGSVISWRVQQGFPQRVEENDEGEKLSTPEIRMREMRLQTIAPFLALVAIYRAFLQGHGKGIAGYELQRELNLPSPWVSDALDTLESMNYIIAGGHSTGADMPDLMSARFFPTNPAEKISLDRLRGDLLEQSAVSIEKWNQKVPDHYIQCLGAVNRLANSGSTASATLAQIVA